MFKLLIIFLSLTSVCYAQTTYELTEKVIQIPSEEELNKPTEEKEYYITIYDKGNKLVEGIKVTSKEEAQKVCGGYVEKYNLTNNTKISTVDIKEKVEK